MANVEERLAYLEGRVAEHPRAMNDMREMIVHLDQRIDRLDQRMDRLDERIVHLEERIDRRFEGVDQRLDQMDRRLSGLDEKMTRYFVWGVGIMVSALAAIVTAFVAKP